MNSDHLPYIRQKCEDDFLFFLCYFFKKRYGFNFIVNSHHLQMVDALMRVYRGEIVFLIINMPPRYGKTEVVVISFAAWCIARNSASKFIHLSYSDDLALENSGQIKELITSEFFQELWPVSLKADSQSKKKWYTDTNGGMMAASAGGPVTGFGAGSTDPNAPFAGAILIDDPLKPDDATSDKERGRVNKRLNSTIMSRRNSRRTPVILTMQRLHEEDMSGYVMAGGVGMIPHTLVIPAIDPVTKQALWPAKHTLEELKVLHLADQYDFSGQYMQKPVPDEGIFFRKDWFNWYDPAQTPVHLNNYGGADYAVTEDGGDFTELGVFGVDPSNRIYVLDWISGQVDSETWVDDQIDLTFVHHVLMWAGEMGQIRRAVEPWLTKEMRRRRCNTVLNWYPHNAENYKQANARTFQALVKNGYVYLPIGEQWATDLVDQLIKFPRGKLDDKVDACSLFGRMINEIWGAAVPSPPIVQETDAWGRPRQSENAWKVA